MLPTPLQVVVFSCDSDEPSNEFRRTMVECFQGGGTGYLAGAEDTGVPVLEYFEAPSISPEDSLGRALHTLGIVLVSRRLLENDALLSWLKRLADAVETADAASVGSPHKLLVLDLDNALGSFFEKAPSGGWPQAASVDSLGERAVRTTVASLIALNLAMQSLSGDAGLLGHKLRFFVSHAKLDGQPLARVLSSLIKDLPGFQGFYDAEDIPIGSNWRKVLEKGVHDSILIVLRSDIYETRPWCVQEMRWAEEFASPFVVVDLRHRLIEPASHLQFDRSPTVRVPDGNLFRVVFIALREGLRARLHVRTVDELVAKGLLDKTRTRVLVRQPTMHALQAVCAQVSASEPVTILYPDPRMHVGEQQAAEALARSFSPKINLTTPQTLAAEHAATGRSP